MYRPDGDGASPIVEETFPLEMKPWMRVVFADANRLLVVDPSSTLTVTPYAFGNGKWAKAAAEPIALSGAEVDKTKAASPPVGGQALGTMRVMHVVGDVTARDGRLLLVMSGGGREDPGPRIVAFDADGKETASYRPAGDRKLLRPNLAYVDGDSIVIFDRSGVRHRFERP